MKIIFLVTAIIIASVLCCSAQHSLQLDDGIGNISVIQPTTSGGFNLYQLPPGGGILLATGTLPNFGWALGGNPGSSPNNQLGTTDATPLEFITGGSNVRMSIDPIGVVSIGSLSQFQVDNSGNISKINNVGYSFPSTQASMSGQVLSNDGNGSLSWVANGSTITTTTNSQYTGGSSLTNPITNDLSLASAATYFRVNATVNTDLTGLSSTGFADGHLLILANIGATTITLRNEDSGSSPSNRFDLPGAADILLGAKGSATLVYDATESRWKLVSTN